MKILNREIEEVVSLMRKQHDEKESARFEKFKQSSQVRTAVVRLGMIKTTAKKLPKAIQNTMYSHSLRNTKSLEQFVAYTLFKKVPFDRQAAYTRVTLTASLSENMNHLLSKLKLKL